MNACRPLIALALASLPIVAQADDNGPNLDRPGFELGGRYWYSTGRIGYGYYGDTTTSLLVSRLTYDQLTANSGEIYARGDIPWGVFIKGFVGLGAIAGGHLIDEDFPPVTFPYSETSSTTSGSLSYGTVDLCYSILRQPNFRLGGFAGYGRWNENVTASGCTQLASYPICQPPFTIPTSIAVINEKDNWNLLRLGATADLMLGEHIRLTADAAYVRALSQKAVDDHFFTFGVDPASGNGNGFQLEAIAAYQLTNAFSLGVGGRWWHLNTNAIDSFQQLETYSVDRYGAFVQGSYKFGN
jgi:outer membrane protease